MDVPKGFYDILKDELTDKLPAISEFIAKGGRVFQFWFKLPWAKQYPYKYNPSGPPPLANYATIHIVKRDMPMEDGDMWKISSGVEHESMDIKYDVYYQERGKQLELLGQINELI